MSIEVRVPEEIADYKESIIAGLSLRQLICSAIALAFGIPTFLLLKNINQDVAMYATMLVVVPAFCIGFIKPNEYNFEVYAKIKLYNFFSKYKRGYETEPEKNIYPYEIDEFYKLSNMNMEVEESKGGEKNVKTKTKYTNGRNKKAEYDLVKITTKNSKRTRKATYKTIKNSRRKNRKTKQIKKETIESRSCT